jgi:DNA primase
VAAAGRIQDKALATEYRRALLDRFFESGRRPAAPGPDRRGGGKFRAAPPPVRIGPRPSPRAEQADAARACTLTAILIRHPYLLHGLEEAYGALPLPEDMDRLRGAILAALHRHESAEETPQPLDSDALLNHLHTLGLDAELARALEATPSCARKTSQPAEAEAGWWHFYGLMHREGLEDAVAAASRFYEQTQDQAAFSRLNALCIARDRLRRGEQWGDQDAETEAFDS